MGVRGLQAFLQSVGAGRAVSLAALAREARAQGRVPLLVVDGNGLLFHLFERNVSAYGSLRRPLDRLLADFGQLAAHVQVFLDTCASAGLELVVVMDGLPDPAKSAQAAKWRSEILSGGLELLAARRGGMVSLVEARGWRLPLPALAEECLVETLRRRGVHVYYADGENDLELARVARERDALAVLALDSDFCIYEVPGYVPFPTLAQQAGGDLCGTLFERGSVAAALRIRPQLLPHLACLVGNDFLRPEEDLRALHQRLLSGRAASWATVIPAVAAALARSSGEADAVQELLFQHAPGDDAERAIWMRFSEALGRYGFAERGLLPAPRDAPMRLCRLVAKDGLLSLAPQTPGLPAEWIAGFRCGDLSKVVLSVAVDHAAALPLDAGSVFADSAVAFLSVRRALYQEVLTTLRLAADQSANEERKAAAPVAQPAIVVHESGIVESELPVSVRPERRQGDPAQRLFVVAGLTCAAGEAAVLVAQRSLPVLAVALALRYGRLRVRVADALLLTVVLCERNATRLIRGADVTERAFADPKLWPDELGARHLFAEALRLLRAANELCAGAVSRVPPLDRSFSAGAFHALFEAIVADERDIDDVVMSSVSGSEDDSALAQEVLDAFYTERQVLLRLAQRGDERPPAQAAEGNQVHRAPRHEDGGGEPVNHKSALVLAPPSNVWEAIQALRQRYDKSYMRWLPHINILYPFVVEEKLDLLRVVQRVRTAVRDLAPFVVRLAEFGVFRHSQSATVWLRPDATPTAALMQLQARLQRAFPPCDALSSISERGFTPHLSVAQFASGAAANERVALWQRTWQPIEFLVDCVHVITRGSTTPFLVRHSVPLGADAEAERISAMGCPPAPSLPRPYAPVPRVGPEEHIPRHLWEGAGAQEERDELVHSLGAEAVAALECDMPPSRHIGSVRFRAAPTFFFSPDYGEWRQLAVERFGTLRARRLLRVVTWNVLCDQFEAELIASEQRVPAVCRALERLAPDVIALQEVTRAQWDALLSEEWVRRSYFASFAPGERALDPYGQAILARLPFHTHLHALSRNKMVVAAEMCVNGHMLLVPCVHLTSDHHGDMSRRIEQLRVVFDWLTPSEARGGEPLPDALVVGDFNFGDMEDGEELALSHTAWAWKDAWRVVRPRDAGFTFDPEVNALARVTNPTSRRRRLDRVLVAEDGAWRPTSAATFGHESWQHVDEKHKRELTLLASDHFGVVVTLEFVLPRSSSALRVEEDEKGVTATAAAVSAEVPAQPPRESHALERALMGQDVLGFVRGAGLAPPPAAELAARHEATLRVLTDALSGVLLCGPEGFRVFVVGSAQIGTAAVGSDLDLVVVGNLESSLFFPSADRVLRTLPGVLDVRLVADALVPVLRATVAGVEVDVQYCCMTQRVTRRFDPETLSELELARLAPSSALALSAVLHGLALQRAVAANRPMFAALCGVVKAWARRRGVYSSRLGFLGGFGWALLAARVAAACPGVGLNELVLRFFTIYASWNWSTAAVAVGDARSSGARRYRRQPHEHMVVLTPSPPLRNAARNSTRSSVAILRSELARALRARSLSELFEPASLLEDASLRSVLQVSVGAETRGDFVAWCGLIESRLVPLVLALERVSDRLTVRVWPQRLIDPDPAFPLAGIYALGLSLVEAAAAEQADASPRSSAQLSFEEPVQTFLRECENWRSRAGPSASSLFLRVRNTKPAALRSLEPDLSLDSPSPAGNAATANATPAGASAAASQEAEADVDSRTSEAKAAAAAVTAVEQPRKKMRTSEQIINRLNWGADVDLEEFTVVYEDRFKGMVEVPLSQFRKGDEVRDFVPLHRIWLFKRRGAIVWDRKAGIDRVG